MTDEERKEHEEMADEIEKVDVEMELAKFSGKDVDEKELESAESFKTASAQNPLFEEDSIKAYLGENKPALEVIIEGVISTLLRKKNSNTEFNTP